MVQIAKTIVRWRYVIILLFLAAAVYCGLSLNRVQVSSDLTVFLASSTETRRGLTIMEDEFVTYAAEDIMVSNITYSAAEALADQLRDFDGVASVAFDDTPSHYASASALFSISFEDVDDSPSVKAAREQIDLLLSPYDTYAYSMSMETRIRK